MALDFNWLKENFEAAKKGIATELTKFNNRSMLEAIVASCTMVAYADGVVTAAEKQKMMKYISSSEALNVFDSADTIAIFQKYAAKFEFDYEIGLGEVLTVVSKFKNKPEAQLIVRVCCAIGAADGNFDQAEKQVVRKMCQELGLDPQIFNL